MANESKKATGADADKRKKITILLIVVVVVFLGWQISDMMGGGSSSTAPIETPPANMANNAPGAAPSGMTASQVPGAPPPQVAQPLPMSQREAELLRLQQQTQTKYIETMNELQMLKLALEIAETNKSIMAAKLATIKDQKDIVEILTPPKKSIVADYSRTLAQQPTVASVPTLPQTVVPNETESAEMPSPRPVEQMTAPGQQTQAQREEPDMPYTVVSVSKIQDRWSAVIGVQGALFSIHIGDIIPADGSKVMKINSRGIVLERKGKERRVSLVPII